MDATRLFSASYDAVWGSLIGAISRRGMAIQSSDKASGLLQIQLSEQNYYAGVEKTIDQVAYRPNRPLAVWRALTLFSSIHVSRESESQTRVTVSTVIRETTI